MPFEGFDEVFESGTEITFNCIRGAAGEKTTWKIMCDDGIWSGKSYDCSNYHSLIVLFKASCLSLSKMRAMITVNGTCIFFNDEPNVVSFYNDLQIREGVVEFPPGATVVSR